MFALVALTVFGLLVARVARAPAGTWRYILGAAAALMLASQLLPAGHAFRTDVAASARSLAWLGLAAVPIGIYALWIRGLRRRTGVDAPARAPGHPTGLVQIPDDAALVAETGAALAAEAAAAGVMPATLSLGWRATDGALAGHLRLRQTGETGEIEALWVAGPHRGRGIGSRLLAAAEGEARLRGLRRMAVAPGSWQAPGFFGRAGYRVVAERDLGRGLGRVWMERDLV